MDKADIKPGFAFPTTRFYPSALRIRSQLAREVLCEFICTTMFLTIGIGCVIQIKTSDNMLGDFLSINIAWGFAVMFACSMGIWLSGGHLNPAVSLTQWFLGIISLKKALAFSVAQTFGAFVGTAIAYADYVEALDDFDGGRRVPLGENGSLCMLVTCPSDYTTIGVGIFDQIIGTGILTATMAAMIDKRAGISKWLHPVFGGIAVMMIGMSFAKNASYPINPGRDLGSRLFALIIFGSEAFTVHSDWWYVPIVGPIIGGFVGAVLYQIFIDAHSELPHDSPTDAGPEKVWPDEGKRASFCT